MSVKIIQKLLQIVLIVLFVLATVPVFFEIYRTLAFNTVPHDDYALYLLALVNQGGRIPGAPFVYRILSVAVSIPAFYLLPTYAFTYLQQADPTYLKANEALAFMSYLWLVLTAVVIYKIARKRASKPASVATALSTFLLAGFVSRIGIDPFAILIISLLVLFQDCLPLFIPLILVSIGINEKIAIIFASLMLFRCAFSVFQHHRPVHLIQCISSILATAVYFVLVLVVLRYPGNESQVNPTLFLDHFIQSILNIFSLKGAITNGLPILLIVLLIILALQNRKQVGFQIEDGLVFLVILFLALIADLDYTVGRIVMYVYPLYLPAAAVFLDGTSGTNVPTGKNRKGNP